MTETIIAIVLVGFFFLALSLRIILIKDGEFKDWYVMMYYNLIDDSLEEIEVSRKKSELI